MRGTIEGLETPHPIGTFLPGLFHDDDFTQRFVAGLDEVLAPIFLTLDAVEAYADPRLAPMDFVDWLAQWVGVSLDENLTEERQRELVAQAAGLYGRAGTAAALADLIEAWIGVRPEVEDSGAASWSPTPGADLPGTAAYTVTVRLRLADPAAVDQDRLRQLIEANIPAHIVPTLEVVSA
jgi:phage tail-like protein